MLGTHLTFIVHITQNYFILFLIQNLASMVLYYCPVYHIIIYSAATIILKVQIITVHITAYNIFHTFLI